MPSWRDPNDEDYRAGQSSFSSRRRRLRELETETPSSEVETETPKRGVAGDELLRRLTFIYDEYRTVMLNRKYNAMRLMYYSKINSWMEIIIAISVAASTVFGINSTTFEGSRIIWVILSTGTVILATMKPVLNMTTRIGHYSHLTSEYSELVATYRHIIADIDRTRSNIQKTKKLPNDIEGDVERIRRRVGDLARLEDLRPSRRIMERLQREVNEEVPPEKLWLPL